MIAGTICIHKSEFSVLRITLDSEEVDLHTNIQVVVSACHILSVHNITFCIMRSVRGILESPPDVTAYDIDMYCYDLENTWHSLHMNQCRCRVLKMSREHERI